MPSARYFAINIKQLKTLGEEKKKKCVEKEKARQIIKTIQECGRCHSEAEVTLRQKQIQSN